VKRAVVFGFRGFGVGRTRRHSGDSPVDGEPAGDLSRHVVTAPTNPQKKSDKISGSAFQALTTDHCSILKQAFESYLVWECFGDLIRKVQKGSEEYPRVFFFQPLTLAFVNAAFDSFIVNLYKFYDNRSHELETLVQVGVKHGCIEPWLESSLREKIKDAASFAAKKNIEMLRNRNVGHYVMTALPRSALTTIHPTKEEIRDYFERLATILETCASRARFDHSPLRHDQFEKRIRDTAEIVIRFVCGQKGT
jgi:hypothetical protein